MLFFFEKRIFTSDVSDCQRKKLAATEEGLSVPNTMDMYFFSIRFAKDLATFVRRFIAIPVLFRRFLAVEIIVT